MNHFFSIFSSRWAPPFSLIFLVSLNFVFLKNSLAQEKSKIKSFLTQIELSQSCFAEYQKGFELFFSRADISTKVQSEETLSQEQNFEEWISEQQRQHTSGGCLSEWTIGVLEGQELARHLVGIEYFLELTAGDLSSEFLKLYFQKRLRKLFFTFSEQESFFELIAKNEQAFVGMLESLQLASQQSRRALVVGRFVITPKKFRKFLTTYEIVPLKNTLEFSLQPGSYQKSFEFLKDSSLKIVREYLDWKPSAIFGEDSFLKGAFWRAFGKDSHPSLREIKEQTYFEAFDLILSRAESLGLDPKAFLELKKIMLKKQKAFLERDIQVLESLRVGLLAAPAIPLGMAAGAAGLGYVGLAAPQAASFTLSLGGLASAANVSALSAGAVMLGVSSYKFFHSDFLDSSSHSIVNFSDRLLYSLVSSFPLAAVTPVVVGGGLAGGKFLIVEGKAFLFSLHRGFEGIKALGLQGTLRELPKLPQTLLRAWVSSWWKKDASTGVLKFNRSLLTIQMANNTASVIAEYVDREFIRSEPDEKFFVEKGINKKVIYRLVPSAFVGVVGAPLIRIENYFTRFLAWRILDAATIAGVSLIVEKKPNHEFVFFETIYGSTVGNALGELNRVVSLAIMNMPGTQSQKFMLQTLFRLAFAFPKTSTRNYFLETYLDRRVPGAQELRQILSNNLGVELRGFSDEELIQAFSAYLSEIEQEENS